MIAYIYIYIYIYNDIIQIPDFDTKEGLKFIRLFFLFHCYYLQSFA